MTEEQTLTRTGERGCAVTTGANCQKHRRRLPVALIILALTAASAVAAEPKVYQTGYEISRAVRPSLFWVDNDRLLFAGMNTADMEAAIARKEGNREGRLKKLYLWDATTNSVKLYADAKAVCVADGIVRYPVRMEEAGKIIERVGPFGSEKEIETPASDEFVSRTFQSGWVYSKFTCRKHLLRELIPPPERRRQIIVLREGDGYLDVGPLDTKELRNQRTRSILLFHPARRVPLELPMKIEQGPGNLSYSAYLAAYVTRPRPQGSDPGHITSWPQGLPFTIYTFNSAGDITRSIIPYEEWGTIAQILATRAGWIFAGHGVIRAKGGLFLFQNSSGFRLDTGQVYDIAVSRDGCRAAVGIQNRHLDMGTPINLKVFDICKGAR